MPNVKFYIYFIFNKVRCIFQSENIDEYIYIRLIKNRCVKVIKKLLNALFYSTKIIQNIYVLSIN